jgi:hypothetical protein
LGNYHFGFEGDKPTGLITTANPRKKKAILKEIIDDLDLFDRDKARFDEVTLRTAELETDSFDRLSPRTKRSKIAYTAEDVHTSNDYREQTIQLKRKYVELLTNNFPRDTVARGRVDMLKTEIEAERVLIEAAPHNVGELRKEFGVLILLFCSVLNPTPKTEQKQIIPDNLGLDLQFPKPAPTNSYRHGHMLAYLYDPGSEANQGKTLGERPQFIFGRFTSPSDALEWAWDDGKVKRQIGKCAILGYNMLQAGLTLQYTATNSAGIQRRYLPNYVACKTSTTTSIDTALQVVGRSFVDFKNVEVPSSWRINLLADELLHNKLTT